jgi:hypothetical protein
LWLEFNLKISRKKDGHGFFTNIGARKLNYYGRLILSFCVVIVVLFAWIDVNKSSKRILITLEKQQRVQTRPIHGSEIPTPEFKLQKGEKK